jgi:DNA-binding NarL/FixJ family response regulator
MTNALKVLAIDDHPVMLDVYKNALQHNKNLNYTKSIVDQASSCDEAVQHIKKQKLNTAYHIVILDIGLPASDACKAGSGEDIGELIRTLFPKTKIIVVTAFNDHIRVNNILNNLNPEGFLIKSDISLEHISKAVEAVLDEAPYYSRTVLKVLRQKISVNLSIDKIDRQLLHELSIGTKMKDLPKVIPMSIAGLERRKRLLRDTFSLTGRDDKTLIAAAKRHGFI